MLDLGLFRKEIEEVSCERVDEDLHESAAGLLAICCDAQRLGCPAHKKIVQYVLPRVCTKHVFLFSIIMSGLCPELHRGGLALSGVRLRRGGCGRLSQQVRIQKAEGS